MSAVLDGASEPVVSVDWHTVNEAVDSYLELMDTYGATFTRRAMRLLLTLFIGEHYRSTSFQLLAPDDRTVLTIERIQPVGIPTVSER